MIKMIKKQFICLGILGTFCAVNSVAGDAVTVFTNGTVYTSNAQAPWASSVVVKGDKIVFVGNDSSALEVAGIDRDTQDIVPGFAFYQRDESGEPSGWITESAASLFVNKFVSITPAVEDQIVDFLTYLRNLGVTTLLDAGNFGLDDETYAALSRLDKAGRLPLRYHAAFTFFYRFKDLGVIASFTPYWHGNVGDHNVQAAIGDRAWSQMRAQPMIADDAVFTFSSDITTTHGWRDEAANPYHGMQIGHNRQPVEGGPDGRYARPRSERIRLDTLIDGYTINGAYQLGRSHELGSIEVGKQADLVVLNQNLFDVNRYDIHKTKPVAVIMDGELVHGEL